MRKIVIGFLIFMGLSLLVGCTLSLDFHPEGKKTPASTE